MSITSGESTNGTPHDGDRQAIDGATIIQQIRSGDPQQQGEGEKRLAEVIYKRARFLAARTIDKKDEAEDALHSTYQDVRVAILEGRVDNLVPFVITVLKRKCWAENARPHNKELELNDALVVPAYKKEHNPEREAIAEQQKEQLQQGLSALNERDRQILERYYLEEQPQEQIMREMNLTDNQFRVLKSRAKQRLVEIMRKNERPKPGWQLWLEGQMVNAHSDGKGLPN